MLMLPGVLYWLELFGHNNGLDEGFTRFLEGRSMKNEPRTIVKSYRKVVLSSSLTYFA